MSSGTGAWVSELKPLPTNLIEQSTLLRKFSSISRVARNFIAHLYLATASTTVLRRDRLPLVPAWPLAATSTG
jgi:hypothetical protein